MRKAGIDKAELVRHVGIGDGVRPAPCLGNPLEKVCGSKPVHAAPQARFAENRRGDATGD